MLHIIQNDPEVPPGCIADDLQTLDIPFQLHHPYRNEPLPASAEIGGLIVLGGAMHANDHHGHPFLLPLKQLIRDTVHAGIPYLGICLGGQLLAAALGGRVVQNRWEELGTLAVSQTPAAAEDLLFVGVDTTFCSFQWHHDSFDLPPEAELLATSSACPHQAFRIGTTTWGLQFHPEVDEGIIRAWCAWSPETATLSNQLAAEFMHHHASYRRTARLLLTNFLAICRTT